jgi:hypothetical protein
MNNICFVCETLILPFFKYCPRCGIHIDPRRERLASALALKAAFDKKTNRFICFYTGVALEETDRTSPWYLTFDHRIPGQKGDLVVCARWINNMKCTFSDKEFKAISIELDRSHKAKEPFNMAVAEFKYWKGPADQEPRKMLKMAFRRIPNLAGCDVCHRKTSKFALYCPICQKLVQRGHSNKERVAPLQVAWDEIRQCFICYLTRLEVELNDRKSPRYISFDHRIPRQAGTLAVAVAFVNLMKTDLSEEEFWLVVGELADHFRTGKAFNRDIIKFAYWKRPAKARKGRK